MVQRFFVLFFSNLYYSVALYVDINTGAPYTLSHSARMRVNKPNQRA
jgi:hypothetical protein